MSEEDSVILREASRLHKLAMQESCEGDKLKALTLEAKAFALLKDNLHLEPSRSILAQSAAWLAIKAGAYNKALNYANLGLAGNPDGYTESQLIKARQRALKVLDS